MKKLLIALMCACLLLALLPLAVPPALMINEVSLSASHTAAYVGDTLSWTACNMDGAGDYLYHFEIIRDKPVFIDDWDNWRPEPSISWLMTKPGTYHASVMVYDTGWDDYAQSTSADTEVSLHPAPEVFVESLGPDSLLIAWEPVPGAGGYDLMRGSGQAGPFTSIGLMADSRHTDTSLTEGTLYWYKVSAYIEVNGVKYPSSELSGAASGIPMAAPLLPEVKTLSNSSLSIAWNTPAGVSGCELWRGTAVQGPYTNIFSSKTAAFYIDTGLTAGTMYWYKALAYKIVNGAIYDGPFSDPMAGMPMDVALDAPVVTSLAWRTAPDGNNTPFLAIDLTWTPVNNAVGYEVFARVGNAGDYQQWTETSQCDVLAGFLLPEQPTRYWLKVRAYTGFTDPPTNELLYLTGPFSPEVYIDVPALTTPQPITMLPPFTLEPILPSVTPGTPVPVATPRRVTIHLITASPPPTPQPVTRRPATIAPVVTIRQLITLVPRVTILPAPEPTAQIIIPLEPVIPLEPIRRISP